MAIVWFSYHFIYSMAFLARVLHTFYFLFTFRYIFVTHPHDYCCYMHFHFHLISINDFGERHSGNKANLILGHFFGNVREDKMERLHLRGGVK